MKQVTYVMTVQSPLGPLTLVSNGQALTGIHTMKKPALDKSTPLAGENDPVLRKAKKQLEDYFAGRRRDFDLPLDGAGTPFQKKVWKALSKIPFGKTASYKDVAVMIGNPKASRAVGMANGKNPLCIVIPCHRVISHDGSLGGYTGGLSKKRYLLGLEAAAQ